MKGLNFKQLIGFLPWSPPIHLTELDAIPLFNLLPEPVIADRLAVMRGPANKM
jgi:hypothetical protein